MKIHKLGNDYLLRHVLNSAMDETKVEEQKYDNHPDAGAEAADPAETVKPTDTQSSEEPQQSGSPELPEDTEQEVGQETGSGKKKKKDRSKA